MVPCLWDLSKRRSWQTQTHWGAVPHELLLFAASFVAKEPK